MRRLARLALGVVLVLSPVAACGSSDDPEGSVPGSSIVTSSTTVASSTVATTTSGPPSTSTTSTSSTTSTTTTPPAPSTTAGPAPAPEVAAYYFFDGYPVEPGPYLVAVARPGAASVAEALTALLAGVTGAEAAMGLSTPVPAGTRLLGVDVSAGVAAVDLSAEFESGGGSLSVLGRVAQVVYTATQFDGIDAVEFLIDGTPVDVLTGEGLIIDRPQSRADYADLVPAILVDRPYWGSAVDPPMTISGSVAAGSGPISFTVVDGDGTIVATGPVPVTANGERVDFAVDAAPTTDPAPGPGSVIVFETAPDGQQRHVLEYPIRLTG